MQSASGSPNCSITSAIPALALDEYAGVFQTGGKHFIFRNNGLQNQYVLYVTDKPGGPERVLLDPNVLRADGTAALSALSVDHKGKLAGVLDCAGGFGLVGMARPRHRNSQGSSRT